MLMSLTDAILQEFKQESATTRRVLERVPDDRLTWKPHAKSMSLGVLALHLASSPGAIAEWGLVDSMEFPAGRQMPEPTSNAEILAAHDQGVKKLESAITRIGDEGLRQNWQATKDGVAFMKMPKIALVRAIVLNHAYHHRGQLSVYLRLIDVPVPSIYGPSADENPFMVAAQV
jgi:uncharacterized damage-inducible protein DinB